MANALALADLEALLRARKLDRVVAKPGADSFPSLSRGGEPARPDGTVPTGIAVLDERLGGGLPRGQISEIAGARSSGRTTLMHAALGAATARGELAALVDALDMFDPESAASCGVVLDRLLWVRGEATAVGGRAGASLGLNPQALSVFERLLDRALKAVNLVLQAGGFDLVVLDLAEAPAAVLRRLPFTTWFRLQRTIEGGRTACLVVAPSPMTRSADGASIQLAPASAGGGPRSAGGALRGVWTPRLFRGLDIEARIVRARDPDSNRCRMAARA